MTSVSASLLYRLRLRAQERLGALQPSTVTFLLVQAEIEDLTQREVEIRGGDYVAPKRRRSRFVIPGQQP